MSTRLSLPQALQQAAAALQQGPPQAAEALCRMIIQALPQQPEALHLLGVALLQQGRHGEARQWLQRALALRPEDVMVRHNLGLVLFHLGELDAARAHFLQAATQRPDFARARASLGLAELKLGRYRAAIDTLQQALQGDPNYPEAWSNLGAAYKQQGEHERALEAFRQARRLRAEFPEAWQGEGACLAELGDYPAAERCLRQALQLRPGYRLAQAVLGRLLFSRDADAEAERMLRAAIAAAPEEADAHYELAAGLRKKGALSAARAVLESALQHNQSAKLHNLLGVVLLESNRLEAAQRYFRAAFAASRQANDYSAWLFAQHYRDRLTPAELLGLHKDYETHFPAAAPPPRALADKPRLRVGYVSGDLRHHSVAYFMREIFAAHDPEAVALFAYHCSADEDEISAELKQHTQGWRQVAHWSADKLSAQIRADGIDILVDLAGHTSGNRLPVFQQRPAPVQISYLGYPSTTGLASIAYRLTDRYADPPQSAAYSSEKLLYLPHSYFCYRPPDSAAALSVGDAPCLNGGGVCFGSFNNYSKLSPEILQLWAEVLRTAPDSRLLLKNRALRDPDIAADLQRRFQAWGIGSERLELCGFVRGTEQHLRLYRQVDIGLDSWPYNGATTTCEALWMGVPTVSLSGRSHASRMGQSILHAAGLENFSVSRKEDFVRTALHWAAQPERLNQLRQSLRVRLQASPLMDGTGFTRALENLYRQAWQQSRGA